MKGKKCFGLLLVLSIIFGLSLSVSSDVNALTFTMEVTPTGNEITNPDVKCLYGANSNWYNSTGTDSKWTCNNAPSNANGDVNSVQTIQNYHFEEGYYYQVQMVLRNNDRSSIIAKPIYWNFYNNDDFTNVALEIYYDDDRETVQKCGYTYSGNAITSTNCIETVSTYNQIMLFTVRANRTGDYPFRIGTDTAVLIRGNYPVTQLSDYKYTFGLRKITEFKASGAAELNEKDNEDRSNIESQSTSTDNEANDGGDDASETGTSLFSAFTQLLSALTNVNGNTCTLPAMQVYSLNLGNMNLCQYDIPPQIMALVSIGIVFIIIPLGINLVKRMISLYKEITG